MSSIDVSAAPAPDVVRPGPPRIHLVPAADSTAAAAAPRTPTDTEVASIFNPSTGLCEWKVRIDQCELTYGHGAEIVGRRVAVYWEGDKCWYTGTVNACMRADQAHVIMYDDDDSASETLHFVHTRWRFLIEPTSPSLKSHADTGTPTGTAAFCSVAGRRYAAGMGTDAMTLEQNHQRRSGDSDAERSAQVRRQRRGVGACAGGCRRVLTI